MLCFVGPNILEFKFISIHGLVFTSGSLVFPLSYIFSDILTEVYGFQRTRQLMWIAVIGNFTCVAFMYLSLVAPYPESWQLQETLNLIFGIRFRIAFVSALCYFLGDYINCRVLSKLKIKYAGKKMWLRFLGSTAIGALLDVSLFTLLSFSFIVPIKELIKLISCDTLFKVSYEMVMLPITVRVCNLLKRIEKTDVYDFKTNFSPFSMGIDYDGKENYMNKPIVLVNKNEL